MNPADYLALLDFALSVVERAPSILNNYVSSGDLTPEQRAERMAKIADSRSRVGLPPVPPAPGP